MAVEASNVALMLEELIAAPLKALVDAQSASADATKTFLLSLMREERREKKEEEEKGTEIGKKEDIIRVPETIKISYEQIFQDPQTGELRPQKQTLVIPILSLIPMPYISIDESDIEFDAKIITSKKEVEKAIIYATYASKSKSDTDLTGEMHIKIKARRSKIPEGLAKVLTVLSNPSVKEE